MSEVEELRATVNRLLLFGDERIKWAETNVQVAQDRHNRSVTRVSQLRNQLWNKSLENDAMRKELTAANRGNRNLKKHIREMTARVNTKDRF